MQVKLISRANGNSTIKIQGANQDQYHMLSELISFSDLMNPEKGFVQDNRIEIEVEIKCTILKDISGYRKVSTLEADAKLPKIECAICLESLLNKAVSSVSCGHIFCTECIKRSLLGKEECPTCRAKVELNSLRTMYLPV